MTSTLSRFTTSGVSYSDLTESFAVLTTALVQLENAVKTRVVTKGPLEYILKSMVQSGKFQPGSTEIDLIEEFYNSSYGSKLPTDIKYAAARRD